MSVTLYLLFFLCISLSACSSARHLSTLDKKLEKKSHFSIKNDENQGFDFSQKELRVMSEGNMMEPWLVAKKLRRGSSNQRVLKAMRKYSGALETESLVSVSWRVPHKKSSETNPGFNLDYSPPKTHPPQHN